MGNLLKLLSREESKKADDIYTFFVDFENCEPTEMEKEVWDKIKAVLEEAKDVLEGLRQYTGAAILIRDAISHPADEGLQEKAWNGVIPLVEQLRKYYDFSLLLENNIPLLLEALCSDNMTSREHLEKQQALFKQFAEILDFVLKFDDLKMTNPVIQNDFSYYRRTESRRRMVTSDSTETDEKVPHEIANRMSLFYAHSTPMLKMLSDTTSSFVSQNKNLPVENTTDCLCTMANICRVMIENPEYCSRIKNVETKLFCLRVMVGVIILYDHVHPVGAFAKSSGIDIKSSIKLLKEQKDMSSEGLLNALRYTTKHLHDESTPKSVKQLLD
ncbi:CYFIP-related Rac1 interactor B-like [Mercenaria mercenaria]|uniref:CYFIP-related Rac1 interactor B-like n=1 Tax=Mercenaria mercenaria TaxID=6596 RepID=UPI001E1DF4E7|nr:CYFIP-related Rac1 interactor B-like [Mercenaria mercenaria]XP_045158828.1 CYFIP-related Rac1 interactor B-like [Mercenaria mercenaria]XP_045158829.1 CYFIP-related Rac1 interactor B-like [Mercenaria mercenaria]XP_045158830.1 CYFIP-related Rac1 interactor B-like [Mercenaria mercenaria]XP_045158831.1 CYFIP-related Rac1 interactor B-like [Mercenaria mercenaria]XP_045158832.1 CYFIP-related Rac1 interactor B-like [Mercenaria mercenaria]